MIELLAPAGNLESLKAAVKSGANAVYLGLDEYNARGNIENFNRENLADAVRFAHLFGCKVYMTLNILIKDAEIEKVVENVRFALSCIHFRQYLREVHTILDAKHRHNPFVQIQ